MIAGVVLAAGTSSRLGGRPKQLLPLHGKPITQHVIDAALAAGLEEVVVVLGHAADEVRAGLELNPPARAVVNPDYGAGQSSSLRVGLGAVGGHVDAALIVLGDQPGVTPEAIRVVVDAYERTGARVVRASYGARPGHPVLLDRRVWAEVEAVVGDRGARELMEQHPDWVVSLELGGERPADVDTWSDYVRLTRQRSDR